jgi:hypothetical protein
MNKLVHSLIENIKDNYIFSSLCTDIIGSDKYYCTCGNLIEKAPDTEFEIEVSYEEYLKMDFIDTNKQQGELKQYAQNAIETILKQKIILRFLM